MRRRDVIKLAAALAGGWPLTARAQKSVKAPVIGVLWPNPLSQFEPIRQGLKDLGYVEGKNIRFEFRSGEGALDKLPEMALDLVRIPVDLIVTLAPQATVAARRATRTIPILFMAHGDPVGRGHVASLARPGGNITGASQMLPELGVKRLQLIRQVVPGIVASSPVVQLSDRVPIGNGKEKDVTILGVSPEYFRVRNLIMPSGRFFDQEDALVQGCCQPVSFNRDAGAPTDHGTRSSLPPSGAVRD